GDAATRPENRVGVRAARAGHGFVLDGNFFRRCDFFQAGDNFRMIATAMRERWAAAELHFAMLRLIDGWIVRRVRHVHDKSDVWLKRVSNLFCAKQADFLL